MAHRSEVVDLVGFYFLDDADEVGGIREVPVVEFEPKVFFVRVLVQVINAVGVQQRRASLDTMHFIAFLKQKFGQICPILPCNPRDQCLFHVSNIHL